MPEENLFSIAFYNTENLFDYKKGVHTLDMDYTPSGRKKWGRYRYEHKINKIGKVLSKIGTSKCTFPPILIGLCEVETKEVVKDITNSSSLMYLPYDCIHYESPDERGIDVALIYNSKAFEVLHSEPIAVNVYEKSGVKDDTRDILYVKGLLYGEMTHIFVNHWPSRRKGIDKTSLKRIELARIVTERIAMIPEDNPKVIVMGDFNDDPDSESIKKHLVSPELINPMEALQSNKSGSLKHNGAWHLFDQILHTKSFTEGLNTYKSTSIFNKDFLTDWTGRNKGEPLRTYIGKFYRGGFSDHFPVYSIFKRN